MSSIKTAISLREDVFADLEAAAREDHQPRSAVIQSALIQYLHERRSRRMTEELNAAYGQETGGERAERAAWLQAARRTVARHLADDEW